MTIDELLAALEAAEAREKMLRYFLRIYIHAHERGNAVPPNIDGDARKALAETAPAVVMKEIEGE